MKHVKFLGFLFLALFLVIYGFVGLFGIVHAFVPVVLNILALVAGIFFLIAIATCDRCRTCDVHDRDVHDRDVDRRV